MKYRLNDRASLRVCTEETFVPVVTALAESVALALGLGQAEVYDLTLAAEEVFNHLCGIVLPKDRWVEIHCLEGGYFVQLDFVFPSVDFDMRTFNITSTLSVTDDAPMEEMGLWLASRSVDRFSVKAEEGQTLRLSLIKEKVYPSLQAVPAYSPRPLDRFVVRSPDPVELKVLADLAGACYGGKIISGLFGSPGKLVDMVGGGEYEALVAVGPSGEIGGGTFWHWAGAKAVEWFGPFLFNQEPDSAIPSVLLDGCIAAIAKTPAVMLLNLHPTPEFPQEDFEYLGDFVYRASDGTISHHDAWARLMREDLGSVVWAHPQLHEFLHGEYERLMLPRELGSLRDQGEKHSPHSVLMTSVNRLQGTVELRPVWWGKDFERNLAQHLELFHQEGNSNIFFFLDLGEPRHAAFTPGLFQNGFRPRVILPYAGAGDLVIFQCESIPA